MFNLRRIGWRKRQYGRAVFHRCDVAAHSSTVILIGWSLGAQAFNYNIETPDGEVLHLTEGTRITNIQVIAGKGRDRQIDVIDVLIAHRFALSDGQPY